MSKVNFNYKFGCGGISTKKLENVVIFCLPDSQLLSQGSSSSCQPFLLPLPISCLLPGPWAAFGIAYRSSSEVFVPQARHIRWPKYWSFSFNISPSNEYSGLISFKMDWLDRFAVQGTLKSLLQPHSLKASILWCSAFLIVQLSHPYMTTGKTMALTRWILINKQGDNIQP